VKLSRVYKKWISTKGMSIQEIVSITIHSPIIVVTDNCSVPSMQYPYYDCNDKGENVKMVYSYPTKKVIAYMDIPNIAEDRAYWHGEYTDGEEPKKDSEYLICCEYKNKFKVGYASFRKGKFYSHTMFCENDKIIGWADYPKISDEKYKSLAS